MDISQKAQDLTLYSDRLQLRSMEPRDAAALVAIVTQPQVGRNLLVFPPDWTVPQAETFIRRTRFAGAPPFRLGVYHQDKLIGSVGVGPGAVPSVFYFIDPAAQGHGFGPEALTMLLSFLFGDLGVSAVVADVFDDNPRSKQILERLGSANVGHDMGGSAARVEPAPITLYRLTKEAFEATL